MPNYLLLEPPLPSFHLNIFIHYLLPPCISKQTLLGLFYQFCVPIPQLLNALQLRAPPPPSEPLCPSKAPDVTCRFYIPHSHSPERVINRHDRFFTSRRENGWGIIYTSDPSGHQGLSGLSPKFFPYWVSCSSLSCIPHTLTGVFLEHFLNKSLILKPLAQGLLLGKPKLR